MKPSNFETTYIEVLKMWDFFLMAFFKVKFSQDFLLLGSPDTLLLQQRKYFYASPFSASGSFPMSRLFKSGSQSISFSFPISPSNEYSGLISFRTDWFDLLAVQGILKSLLQDHSSKATIRCSDFFTVQLSHLYMTIGNHNFDYMTFVGSFSAF